MPPINQQGSRAGIITALVVFVVLFVTSSIFAFQFFGQLQKSQAAMEAMQKRYDDIISQNAMSGQIVTDLQAARSESPSKFMGITSASSVVDVAVAQRDGLANKIMGATGLTPGAAMERASTAAMDAQKLIDPEKKQPVPSLVDAVNGLIKKCTAAQQTIVSLNSSLASSNKEAADSAAQMKSMAEKNQQALKEAQAKRDADVASATAAAEANKVTADAIKADKDAMDAKFKAESDQHLTADAKNQQDLKKAQDAIAARDQRLAARRVDVSNATIRQVDGKLIRVPSNDICYINLGQGDQVTPGLTFEVYDKAEGVPPIPANVSGDEQLPVGKASIEITHVGATSSECRIVHIEPGAILTEGDVIENLVYDPHTKYKFFVFGNFDLANSGRPNPADAEVIKRLVTQWGGQLTDQVNVDSDFVVLGSEPVLPSFTKDEITAENQDKLDKAQAALNTYNDIVAQAKELHIPVMNQNRFLYYVGFYDQAKR